VNKLWLADVPSLLAAEQRIRTVIDAEVERFGAHRVALAGFSQGAVMALYCGLRYRAPLAGIAVYASFPLRDVELFDPDDVRTVDVPIWMGHGVRDWVAPYQMGKELRRQLADRGHPITWNWYPGEHEVYGGVGEELAAFFESRKG
jgi:phospholipase/carboxylesterase